MGISLSGGEPLIYALLQPLVEHAKEEGFRVTMITNGLLVRKQTDSIFSLLDAVAVSFDGLADTHNQLRGRADAFESASSAIGYLADKGLPVAAAISLTRYAIPELPDLVDHLVRLGATAIQIRPIARAGRARDMADSSFYAPADQARLYLVVLALQQELENKVRIHCDLVPALGLWHQREAYAGLLATCTMSSPAERPLADLVNPLVITETGVLKPIAYDFNSMFDLASIATLSRDQLTAYKKSKLAEFAALITNALSQLRSGDGLVDWFDYCTRLSEQVPNTGRSRN